MALHSYNDHHFDRSSFPGRLLLIISAALLSGVLAYSKITETFDNVFYDGISRLVESKIPQDILLIAIDERSLLELGRWPWPREKHVALIDVLKESDVRAIAVDIIFAEPDVDFPETDQRLSDTVAKAGNVILPVFMGLAEQQGKILEIEPIQPLADNAAGLGHVHIDIDKDGVARHVFLKEGLGDAHWKHFALVLHEFIVGQEIEEIPGITRTGALPKSAETLNVRNYLNLIPYINHPESIETVSYVDVLAGRVPKEALRNKTVFVGATAAGMGDQITTPVGQRSGVEVNAHIYHALREGTLITPVSTLLYGLFCAVIMGFFLWLTTRLPPLFFLLSMVLLSLGILILSFIALHLFRLWLPPVPVIVSVLVAYPMWNWWRLENVVAFLRQELAVTQENITFNALSRSKMDIIKNMSFLRDMGTITGWVLFDGAGRKIDSFGPMEASADFYRFTESWSHQNFISSKLVKSPEGKYKLAVMWDEHDYRGRDKISLFIPDNPSESEPYPDGGDQIANTIWQLSRTNLVVEANRKIIDGSLQQLSVGVILARFDGVSLVVNEQAKELLAIDVKNPQLFDLLENINLMGDQSWKVLINELAFFEQSFTVQGDISSSGRTILCRGRVIHAVAPLLLINITDITELKKREREKTEALNFLSHDMRSPMTSVLALIEGAKEENLQPGQALLLRDIEGYIHQNLSYAENFIQLAKLENIQKMIIERCDVHSLIYNAVLQIYPSAKLRNITIHYPETNPELWILCDSRLVERAIVNILDNAVKYSSENTRIDVDTEVVNTSVEIKISDQGNGIPEADLHQLFDCFKQGSNASSGPRSGVGLGLRFVMAVCEKHQGTVTVKNNDGLNDGSGALFTISLPLDTSQ